jgi:hypothetical protein
MAHQVTAASESRVRLPDAVSGTALRLLLSCVGLSLPLYAVLVAPLPPLWSGQPNPRPIIDASAATHDWVSIVVALGFILFLCLPYQPYDLALRLLANTRVSTRLLIGLTVCVAGLGVLIYPHFGSDVFDYAAYERLWVVYGENPLVGLVSQHPGDWIAQFVNVPDRAPAYGPLWAFLTWPIVRLAPDSSLGLVLGYKVLSLAAYATCCWLIWLSVDPDRRQRALVLFAWSPLVIFEVLGKLHNDSLLTLSLVAMVWLYRRGQVRDAWLAIVAGGLVKATALVVAPFVAIQTVRRGGWRGLAPLTFGAMLLGLLAYLPFWTGPETFLPIWQQTSGLGSSVTTLLTVALSSQADNSVAMAVRAVLVLVWSVVACVLVLRHRLDRAADLAAASGWLLIATLLLLTGAIYGHYFVPVVALAAISGEPRLERTVKWLSLGGLAVYGVGPIGVAFDPLWVGTLAYQTVGGVVLFGPVAAAMLPEVALRLWRLRRSDSGGAVR